MFVCNIGPSALSRCVVVISNVICSMASSLRSASDRYFYIPVRANNRIVMSETVRSEIYDIVVIECYDIKFV